MATIEESKIFSRKKHIGQMYGQYYYDKHLHDVSEVLKDFGFSEIDFPKLHKAAYLHDTLEDTATSYNDIKTLFGESVAEIVFAVTDELGRNRKERSLKTHPKIKNFGDALVIKLADRIANITCSLKNEGKGDSLLKMYKKEFPEFKEHLYSTRYKDSPIGKQIEDMWNYLEDMLVLKEQIKE